MEPPSKRAETENADKLVYDCDACDDKFETKFKLIEHQIRIHNRLIDVLPIEVFENILDFLHPNDLVEVSEISNYYKNLVADYFERKRQCGWVKIFGHEFILYRKEKYENYFRSIIRNVIVDCSSYGRIIDNFRFIKENCSKNIRSLLLDCCFADNEVQINEGHMALIGDQIKHLYAFGIVGYGIRPNIQWNRFSQLRMLLDDTNEGQKPWMTEKFRKLHTLHVAKSDCDQDGLTNFIQNHNQIQTFCSDNILSIECTLSSNINLSNAVFVGSMPMQIGLIDHAKMLNLVDQYYSNIKSFELDIWSVDQAVFTDILRRIARMEKVTKLHSHLKKPNFQLLNDDNIQLPHIRELNMYVDSSITQNELRSLAKSFPNVIYLWMTVHRTRTEKLVMSLNEMVSIIVDGLPKLNDLHMNTSNYLYNGKQHHYDLRNWNSVRLKNAPIVTIHVTQGEKYNYDIDGFKSNGVLIKKEITTIHPMRSSDLNMDYLVNLPR